MPACSSSMTAASASRHRYSIASWSPSQSDPLTVSYMCQVQWSGPILPSEAEMPPCAATDDDDVVAVVDDAVGRGGGRGGGGHGAPLLAAGRAVARAGQRGRGTAA